MALAPAWVTGYGPTPKAGTTPVRVVPSTTVASTGIFVVGLGPTAPVGPSPIWITAYGGSGGTATPVWVGGAGGTMPITTAWSTTDKTASMTLSSGNLVATGTAANQGVRATLGKAGGKYYFELTATTMTAGNVGYGVANANAVLGTMAASTTNVCMAYNDGSVWNNGLQATGINLGPGTSGRLFCIALDLTNHLMWFRAGAGGAWNAPLAGQNPATGAGGINIAAIAAAAIFPAFGNQAANQAATANFGARAFAGAVPSGFAAGFF